jgi:UDP-N-acetylglucosamine transferase subunit ALG13
LEKKQAKKILIAPLDWGLGHTTRCMVLVRYLLAKGHFPVMAGTAAQLAFVQQTLPDIETVSINGYNVTAKDNLLHYVRQIPKILRAIKEEKLWLDRWLAAHKVDGIISDNRYGLFSESIPSVFVSNQLRILLGCGSVADDVIQHLQYRYINRFSSTWIADAAGSDNLAGILTHPAIMPHQYAYLGLISQFESVDNSQTILAEDALLILLSGPEPQRSSLSNTLWKSLMGYEGKVIFIEGTDKLNRNAPSEFGCSSSNIQHYGKLTNVAMVPLLQQAKLIIAASGLSTVCDIIAWNKKAVLIPTPGQPEQQYIAKHLNGNGQFFAVQQKDFSLEVALSVMKNPKTDIFPPRNFMQYREVLDRWITSL